MALYKIGVSILFCNKSYLLTSVKITPRYEYSKCCITYHIRQYYISEHHMHDYQQ